MGNYTIREIKPSEINVLKDFLYEAIFQKDEDNLISKDIIKQPEISVYIDNFGKPDDNCLVAEIDGKIVGAVWTRILAGNPKGFGNVNNKTPEFAISLYKDYRNQGIGKKLMLCMLELLKDKGYKQTSLAVQKENYAYNLYSALGFKNIKESEKEYLMLYTFK